MNNHHHNINSRARHQEAIQFRAAENVIDQNPRAGLEVTAASALESRTSELRIHRLTMLTRTRQCKKILQ